MLSTNNVRHCFGRNRQAVRQEVFKPEVSGARALIWRFVHLKLPRIDIPL